MGGARCSRCSAKAGNLRAAPGCGRGWELSSVASVAPGPEFGPRAVAHTVGGDCCWRAQGCGDSWEPGRGDPRLCGKAWSSWKQWVLGDMVARTSSEMSSLFSYPDALSSRSSYLPVPCHCQASTDVSDTVSKFLKESDCGLAEELLPHLSTPASECRSYSRPLVQERFRIARARVCVLQLMNFTNVY